MPVYDYNKARTWNALYRRHVDLGEWSTHPLFGQTVTYGRSFANLMAAPWGDISWHRAYWAELTSTITIPTDASLVFIGAGFGFLAEAATDAGWTNIRTVDDSNFIDAHKSDLAWRSPDGGQTWVEDVPNMRADIQAGHVKAALTKTPNSLRNQIGGAKQWVITEFMLQDLFAPSDPLFDAATESDELADAFQGCDGLVVAGGAVLHLVVTDRHARPPYHVRSLADWKALNPAHLYAPAAYGLGFEVL